MVLILIGPTTGLAQTGEVFLNQGNLSGNPILLEDQRILIQLNDRISFWDIDRNMLLKRYSAGNQFASGMSQTPSICAISERENFLLLSDPDSIYLYHTPTQTRRTLAHPFPIDVGTTILGWFTKDEKKLVLFYQVVLTKRMVRVFDTETMTELDTRSLNQLLAKETGVRADVGNNTLLLFDETDRFLRMNLDGRPILDSFRIEQTGAPYFDWRDFLYEDEEDRIVLKGTGEKGNGAIGLLNPKTGKLEKTFQLSYRIADSWYPDKVLGRVVVRADPYDERSFESGYRYACINLRAASIQEGHIPGITKSTLSEYVEFLHRDGHFLLRCHKDEKTWGVNLNNQQIFQLPLDVKLNWISFINNGLLYRSAADKEIGNYTKLNTLNGNSKKIKLPYQYLHLRSDGRTTTPSIIRKYAGLTFDICRLDSSMESHPYKRLQMQPDSLALYPAGRVGREYYFQFTAPPVVLDDNLEFDAGAFGTANWVQSTFDHSSTRYFVHTLDAARNQFSRGNATVAERLKNSSGFFGSAMRTSEYGFPEIDSLYLIENQTGKVLATADNTAADSLFSTSASSIPAYAKQVRINRLRNQVTFQLFSTLYLLSIQDQHIARKHESDLSKSLANNRSIWVLSSGFCNQDKNLFVIYQQNDSLHLNVLDTARMQSAFHFGTNKYKCEILPAPNGPYFIVNDRKTKKVMLYSFAPFKQMASYPWNKQDWISNDMSVFFSDNGERLALAEQAGNIAIYETKSGKRINQLQLPDNNFKPLGMPDNDVFYYLSTTGVPQAWKILDQKPVPFQASGIGSTTVHESYLGTGDSLLITTAPNAIYWWHLKQRRLFRKALLTDTASVFIGGDSGYYSVNKSAFNQVLYRDPKGAFVGPIQQFDVLYNRPSHFILPTQPNLIAYRSALELAYQKRIRRPGGSVVNTRTIRCDILNKQALNTYLNIDTVSLRVGFTASPGTNLQLHVLANGVPIYGQRGIPLGKGTLDTTVHVKLTEAENELVIYGTDASGNSSNYFPIQLVNPKPTNKGRIYFLGIGIDRFADEQYNLQYSSKDIRDLATKLKQRFGDQVLIDTLFNEQVTADNIRKMKSNLLKTGANDKVIVSYSGHGLLSKDLDYYLSTYSIDFNEPQKGGLPYADLEDLLDNIPARNKLLLIDACHSGEIDKEEGLSMQKRADSMGLTRGLIKETSETKPKIGLQNSFELMRELFVNVGAGTGAMVISAAAGNQFALERGDLKNGVFTYSILEALDKFNTIRAGELRRYVSQRVVELTKGLQQPTVRNENQARDWSVW